MARLGPPLYYVIGPSGAGKDALIGGARASLDGGGNILFAHRYITRPVESGGENHIALSPREFEVRARAGLFAMQWDNHGYRYGIGEEIQTWLTHGFAVVVNGSRGYLDTAAASFPALVPVLVSVPPEVAAARLAARGRESADEIRARLARNESFAGIRHPALRTVENTGSIDDGVSALLDILTGTRASDRPSKR